MVDILLAVAAVCANVGLILHLWQHHVERRSDGSGGSDQ